MVSSSSTLADDSLKMSSDLVSEAAARPCTEELISGGANDTEVISDESQLLFLIDSESGEPCTIIRAFDINGNLVPSYSLVIPETSLPVYGMGFTVIGFNLYMVGGTCNDERLYDSDCAIRLLPTGEVPEFDTKTHILDIRDIPVALKSGQDLYQYTKHGPRMKHKKTLPIVYAVNQTLYVLSRWVHSDEHSSFIDFESLGLGDGDSGDSCSAALPNPPLSYCDDPEPRYYHHSEAPSFRVGSHALVEDKSIVISLEDWRVIEGIYVFDLESSTWARVDADREPPRFIGQHIMVSSGLYYALSLSGSSLAVFDKIPSSPRKEVTIRGASKLVSSLTSHYIATMGDVIFVFRTGCPSRSYAGPVYLTIDKYEASGDGDTITELGETVSYLYNEATLTWYRLDSLFLQPVSLGTRST